MNDYIIFTDTACDLSPCTLKKWGIHSCSLTYTFDGEEHSYLNHELPTAEFYRRMRSGKTAKTSAVNPDVFARAFEQALQCGNDVLYLGFSSALSTTYQSACIAAEDLRDRYPDRKILTVDTLAASAGYGLLAYLTARKKKNGATIEEAAAFAQQCKGNVCHWFTVDSLTYLKRGGRVSGATALMGSALDIRPVMHVDSEGKLTPVKKVRGRKASLQALADRIAATAQKDTPVFISHADCSGDAALLSDLIWQTCGLSTHMITEVGPVIGAHAGPGTLALFFLGSER